MLARQEEYFSLSRAEREAPAFETTVDRLWESGCRHKVERVRGTLCCCPWAHVLLPGERAERNEGMTRKAVFSLRIREWEAHS